MVAKNILQTFGVFAFRFICKKVDALISRRGFSRSDRDDLMQSYTVNLLARSAKFDPLVASWEAFVVVVCENHTADLLEHRLARKRSPDRENGSLNRKRGEGEGDARDHGSDVDEARHHQRTGSHYRPDAVWFEMCEDVSKVIASLRDRQRDICTQLMRLDSITDVAKELRLPRWVVQEEVSRIRARFEHAGLREYL